MRGREAKKREGDEWTLVSPRNRGNKRNLQWRNNNQHSHAAARRVDEVQGRQRTGLHYNDGGVVSYYFTNFPGNYSVEALRRMFAEWGKVARLKRTKKVRRLGLSGSKKFSIHLSWKKDLIKYGLEPTKLEQTGLDSSGIQRDRTKIRFFKPDQR